MFEWLFGKKDDNVLRDLIKVLKNGINININVSGTVNVEQERGNTLEKRSEDRRIDSVTTETKEDPERTNRTKEIDTIPNFEKLSGPEVNFGEETEA